MPLDELLAMYYGGENNESESTTEEDVEQQSENAAAEEDESEPDPPEQPSQLRSLYEPMPEIDQDASRLLRCKYFHVALLLFSFAFL